MKPIILTKDNFTAETAKGITVVDFWAAWCGPCRMMAPVVDELAEEMVDVKFGKVNVDEEPELSDLYNIEVIPTLTVIKDGQVLISSTGVITKASLKAMIEKSEVTNINTSI